MGNSEWLSLGNASGQGAMDWEFYLLRAKDFRGDAFHTQLINRSAQVRHFGWTEEKTTNGEFWLDNQDPYNNQSTGVIASQAKITYFDSPSFECIYSFVDATDAFKAYIRFIPNGAESIPITLGLVTWGWSGRADEDSGGIWTLTNSNVVPPTLVESDEFPVWTKVYSNVE